MISLRAERVAHRYGERLALRDISLEIPGGARFAVVGHNGCGKSTLLRLLALLERPTGGVVSASANGAPLAPDLSLRRRMVLLLQRPRLFTSSVLANVLYGLRVRGTPRGKAREKADWALETTGLRSLAHRPARSLSGGEMQLVSIARALAVEPEVLLLDEVTTHLDSENEERVLEALASLGRQRPITTIAATPDLREAERLADRGVLLRGGQVVKAGAVAELL